MNPHRRILMTTDFTDIANGCAIYAGNTCVRMEMDLWILHVIEEEEERKPAEEKMGKLITWLKEKFPNLTFEPIIRRGSIFGDITATAKEIGAHYLFMGTHGVAGMQFITGGQIFRVIEDANMPVVITQKGVEDVGDTNFDSIMVPMSTSKDTKQKLINIAAWALYFGAKVEFLFPKENDEFLLNKLKRDLKFAHKFFEEKKINFSYKYGKTSGSKFINEVVEYAEETKSGLIAIMNHHETGIFHLLGSNIEQQLVNNKLRIPVFLVNPKTTTVGVGVFGN